MVEPPPLLAVIEPDVKIVVFATIARLMLVGNEGVAGFANGEAGQGIGKSSGAAKLDAGVTRVGDEVVAGDAISGNGNVRPAKHINTAALARVDDVPGDGHPLTELHSDRMQAGGRAVVNEVPGNADA
jgi:hypothetical protein